jgi:chromosome segregation ATPase
MANAQLAQTRDAIAGLQADLNAFRTEINVRLNALKDSLFDDHNRQFGNVEVVLTDLRQRFTTINDQLAAFNQRLTTLDGNLTAHRVHLSDLFGALNQRLAPIEHGIAAVTGRFDRLDQRLGEVSQQLGAVAEKLAPIGHRFDTLQNQIERSNTQTAPLEGRFNLLRQQITTMNSRFDTINEHLASHGHQVELGLQLAPLNQRLTAIDQKLASIDLHSDLEQQFAHHFTELNHRQEQWHEASARQVLELRTESRGRCVVLHCKILALYEHSFLIDCRRRARRNPPKVVKVFCVIL